MATLHLDITDGTKLVETGEGIFEYVVTCFVHGLTGLADARLYDAIMTTAVTDDGAPPRGIPRYFSPHRVIPNVVCLRREAQCVDGDPSIIRVDCFYGLPTVEQPPPGDNAPPQIEGGATIQEFKTERDINGNILNVGYVPFDDTNPVAIYQTGEVVKQVPLVSLRFTWRRTLSPGDLAIYHVGTMNSDVFQNQPAKTWLCAGITFSSNDLGASWNVAADFLYNPETWDGVVAWIDPDTNRIPPDVQFYTTPTLDPATQVGGLKRFVIYKSTQFADIFV